MAEDGGSKEYQFPQYPYADFSQTARETSYLLGLVTSESSLKGVGERPLSLRQKRAEMFREVQKDRKSGNRDSAENLIEKAKKWDDVYQQFLGNQKDLEVDLGDLGVQKVKYVEIDPADKSDKTPVVLLPGISSGLEGTGELPISLAMSGRRVIMLSWPEAWKSEMDPKFVEAVEKNDGLEPHIKFTKEAIIKLIPEGEYELWGVSFGAIMAANASDNRVTNAVLITPPGFENQNQIQLATDFVSEAMKIIDNPKSVFRINPVNKEQITVSDIKREQMLRTFNAVEKRVLGKLNWWEKGLKVKEGGKVKVVSAESDKLARTKSGLEELKEAGAKIVTIKGGHLSPLLDPEGMIEKINQQL